MVSGLVSGASIGAVLLLIALGLTFTFGQMGVINMAHGEFIMAGAYTTYMLQGVTGAELAVPVALPVAFLVAGTMGWALERSVIRFFYGRPLDTLLLTWGVSLMLQQLARTIFGAQNVQMTAPSWLTGQVHLGSVPVPYNRIFIFLLAVGCVVGIWLYQTRLPYGRRMRAVMQNRQLAAVGGVNTGRVDQLTFFIGSGLAGIAGVAVTLIGSVGPTLGTAYIVDAFLIVVVGGLGQLRGAVIAAFVLGTLNSFVEASVHNGASLAKVVVFLVIVAFLQFRPQGLFVLRSRALS
jgi:urea transport system permease protein